VRKGLDDELHGRTFYAVVETSTGTAYDVTVATRVVDALRVGDLVSLEPGASRRCNRSIDTARHPRLALGPAGQTQNRRTRSGRPRLAVRGGATVKLSADTLMAAPELAAVAVLEAALDATVFALAAAGPNCTSDTTCATKMRGS
jgi:hypothetical protein